MLPLRATVDLGAMATKRCSAFPKAPALLWPHHQIDKCHIQNTHWRNSYPSAEVQSVYSTAPADWAISLLKFSLLKLVRFTSCTISTIICLLLCLIYPNRYFGLIISLILLQTERVFCRFLVAQNKAVRR